VIFPAAAGVVFVMPVFAAMTVLAFLPSQKGGKDIFATLRGSRKSEAAVLTILTSFQPAFMK